MKITYQDEHVEAELEVVEATVLVGLKRARLIAEETDRLEQDFIRQQNGDDGPELGIEYNYARTVYYPSLIAATPSGRITVDGSELPFPPSFEVFITLKDALVGMWADAVYRLNPHWLPSPSQTPAEREEAEKKASMPTPA